MPIEYFIVLKIIHIGSLIFWLGPSLGAWCCLLVLRIQEGEFSSATQRLYQTFIRLLILEHLAFVALLLSGFLMANTWFGFQQPWLQWKLLIILGLIVPLEVLDIWYGNIKLAKLFSTIDRKDYLPDETRTLFVYHRYVTGIAIAVIPPSVLGILWLVIAKPQLNILF